MNNKLILLPFLFLFSIINAVPQSTNNTEDVLVVKTIKSPSFEITFEYNQYGKVISEIKEADDDYNSYECEYEYDIKGNMVHFTKHLLYSSIMEENSYNEDNQMIEKKCYTDYGSGFKYLQKKNYTYQNSLLSTIVVQNITSNGQIFNGIKQEYVYDETLKLVQIIENDWINSEWLHINTYSFEYNEMGDILYYSLESSSVKYWRYKFSYNDRGEVVERSYHFGLVDGWNNNPSQKYVYHYEPLEEEENFLMPNFYNFDEDDIIIPWFHSQKKLIKDEYWMEECSYPLHLTEVSNYNYQLITIEIPEEEEEEDDETGICNFLENNVLVYPNPTTGELRMENGEWNKGINSLVVEIYDIYGRNLLPRTSYLAPHTSLDITDLATGIYFLKIYTEQGIITKKIMKK